MTHDRRTFIKGTLGTAVLAAGGRLVRAADAAAPNVRLGIVSDIHIDTAKKKDLPSFVQALEKFRDAQVDGVILSGDMADYGRVDQLQMVADAWFGVFPDDRLPNGSKVERLFIYGNHDNPGFNKGKHFGETAARRLWPDGDEWKRHMISTDPAGAWKTCFKEDFAPIYAKTVKGHVFIGCHWGNEKNLDAFLKANETKLGLKGPRPFFYAQHPHPKDTVNSARGAYSWGRDAGLSTAALSRYPNAVAFSGHSHYPLSNDTTIWQGSFTSVGGGSTSYAGWLNGRDDGEWGDGAEPVPVAPRLGQPCRHALLLSVWDDRMVFERLDLEQKAKLGADWVCPLPACVDAASRPYAFEAAEARAKTPEFPAKSMPKAEMRTGKDRRGKEGPILALVYPAARSSGPYGRLIEYEVTVENLKWGFTRIHTQKRVMAKGHVYADETVVKADECLFRLDELPQHTPIRFRVMPLNSFGQGGHPVFSAEMTLPLK